MWHLDGIDNSINKLLYEPENIFRLNFRQEDNTNILMVSFGGQSLADVLLDVHRGF